MKKQALAAALLTAAWLCPCSAFAAAPKAPGKEVPPEEAALRAELEEVKAARARVDALFHAMGRLANDVSQNDDQPTYGSRWAGPAPRKVAREYFQEAGRLIRAEKKSAADLRLALETAAACIRIQLGGHTAPVNCPNREDIEAATLSLGAQLDDVIAKVIVSRPGVADQLPFNLPPPSKITCEEKPRVPCRNIFLTMALDIEARLREAKAAWEGAPSSLGQ